MKHILIFKDKINKISNVLPEKVNKNILLILLLSLTIVCFANFMLYDLSSRNMVSAVSSGNVYKMGSTGEMVKKIQRVLKNSTAYNGKIDGIYGYETYLAVRKYQSWVGLNVDGIVGSATLRAMGISDNTASSNNSSYNEYLLACAVYGEARGEPYVGQVAVAAVVLNRVRSSKFPNTIAGVIYQKGAFTCVSDGQINLTPNQTARNAARDALNGWDPTYGCLYYWNPRTATSSWIWNLKTTVVIGKHHFAKGGY